MKLIDCACKSRLLDFVLAHGEPVLCRYAPNPRSPGLVPGVFSARSQLFQASVTTDSYAVRIIEDYFVLSLIMPWLTIFFGVWPIALGLLFAFAARIDPHSGRWRRRSRSHRDVLRYGVVPCRHCLQRITIDRFLTFAPKIPPTVPPEVAPLSTSFEMTS